MEAALFEAITKELESLYDNVKAEVVISEIQQTTILSEKDFVIHNESTFSRPYRRDIIEVDPLASEHKLTLHLSRNGIYDTLPEGFFHVPKANDDATNYLSRRKKFQEEEKEARAFFAPLENEFFYQKLQIEKNERSLLDDFYRLNDSFLIEFWDLDPTIPEAYKLKLIKLLPYSYKITGNFELTRRCLEEIIEVPVSLKESYTNNQDVVLQQTKSKGIQLGVDMILDSQKNAILYPQLEVQIGPIPIEEIDNYLKKDGVQNFITIFYEYFVPIEIEVITTFTVTNEEGFKLNTENAPIMGISTQI